MTSQPIAVVVGVCTCKRPTMLRACLDSLAAQSLPIDIAMQIVVVDNEPAPNNQAGVEAFAATSPFPVHYVHQPKRGIAAARNAILDKAMALGADQIAMLDDDETADERWIADLMVEEYRDVPVLVGNHIPQYPDPRPFWAPEKEPKMSVEGATARYLRTGNVRFSTALLRAGLRFDEVLGLTGGEDQRFFTDAKRLGFEARSTNRAATYEAVHSERMTYRFMLDRHRAHMASLAFRKMQDKGRWPVIASLPKLIAYVPLGALELLASLPARAFGRYRFKQYALRGGKRLAQVAGTVAALRGDLPQPYRHVAGH